jgi:hypothetical protein
MAEAWRYRARKIGYSSSGLSELSAGLQEPSSASLRLINQPNREPQSIKIKPSPYSAVKTCADTVRTGWNSSVVIQQATPTITPRTGISCVDSLPAIAMVPLASTSTTGTIGLSKQRSEVLIFNKSGPTPPLGRRAGYNRMQTGPPDLPVSFNRLSTFFDGTESLMGRASLSVRWQSLLTTIIKRLPPRIRKPTQP